MITLKEIKKYIDDDILEAIYSKRRQKLSKMDKKNEVLEKYPMDYENFLIRVKNLPPHFNNTREGIIEAFEDYIVRENVINEYNKEKFYKTGFCDGIRTVLEFFKIWNRH